MKILWLSHVIPYPPKGGVLQRCYNLIKEVSKYHEIQLLSFIQTDILKAMFSSVDKGLSEAKTHLSAFTKYQEYIDIPCERSKYGKELLALTSLITSDPYSINWLKSNKMETSIDRILKESDFDIVHFDTISLAPYASHFPDIPKVMDHHNIESHMMLRRAQQEKNILKKAYYYQEAKKLLTYEKSVCPLFDLHITCSSLDSDRLRDINNSLSIKEVPNGVDVEYFQPMRTNELDNNLIFAGSLNWYPNIDAMLFFADEIWPQLRTENPTVIMNVVGNSPHPRLIELAKSDERFLVHGFVDDVREYISKSSIYVCPIRDGGGTKLKVLDAFAMGMATVAHPVACEGIAVKDGFNVLLAETPSEFVDKINYLLQHPDLRTRIGDNARETALKHYSFEMIGSQLSTYYSRL